MQKLTLNSAALWNAQQTFFEYMADTGRSHLAEQVRARFTPVEMRDNLRLPISCLVHDAELMRTVAKEPHLTLQLVERNKAILLPLFSALRSWQSCTGLAKNEMPIPLCLFIQLCARFWGLNNQIAQFRVAQAKGCLEVSLEPSVPSSFNSTIAEGIATGKHKGFAFRFSYNLLLPLDGDIYKVSMDDWMYQLDKYRVMNNTSINKFGIKVAEVTLFFDKELPQKNCRINVSR